MVEVNYSQSVVEVNASQSVVGVNASQSTTTHESVVGGYHGHAPGKNLLFQQISLTLWSTGRELPMGFHDVLFMLS